jgi:hypothetical protein
MPFWEQGRRPVGESTVPSAKRLYRGWPRDVAAWEAPGSDAPRGPRARGAAGMAATDGGALAGEARKKGGPSLDLEIIAEGEAEEKNEGNRNDVLSDHPELQAFRWNGQASVKPRTEQKFFDLGINGERADERHGIANR